VLDGKTHVLFAGFEDESKKLSGFDNLTEYHYCVSLSNGHDDIDVDGWLLSKFVRTFSNFKKGGQEFTATFKKFTDDEVEEYKKYKENQMKEKRVELWKYYQLFFSDSYRKKHRRIHYRYRPDCKTCGDRSAIDVLTPIVRERYEKLCNALEKKISITEMYDFLDKCTETEWKECLRKVDPHELLKKRKEMDDDDEVMCIPDPRKKAKASLSLCDEFVQKGKGTAETYTQLRELFDENRIRLMFNL